MKESLDRIASLEYFEVPKSLHGLEKVQFVYGEVAGETEGSWLVKCSHTFTAPAGEGAVASAEQQLGFEIPTQYKALLKVTDGAKLFCVRTPWLDSDFPGSVHVWYRLFSCQELVQVNRELFQVFRRVYSDDREFQECRQLNYLAVCEANDGNYQAVLLRPERDRRVFLLFHELFYRPYDERDSKFNYTIAQSLSGWLDLIAASGGWAGRGTLTGGL